MIMKKVLSALACLAAFSVVDISSVNVFAAAQLPVRPAPIEPSPRPVSLLLDRHIAFEQMLRWLNLGLKIAVGATIVGAMGFGCYKCLCSGVVVSPEGANTLQNLGVTNSSYRLNNVFDNVTRLLAPFFAKVNNSEEPLPADVSKS
jgi:hypothetical protein